MGKYLGKVSGVDEGAAEIEAASICQFRSLFEAVVDEFLHRRAGNRSGANEAQTERRN